MQQHVQELLVSSVQLLASLGGTSALDNGPPMPAGIATRDNVFAGQCRTVAGHRHELGGLACSHCGPAPSGS